MRRIVSKVELGDEQKILLEIGASLLVQIMKFYKRLKGKDQAEEVKRVRKMVA